MTNSEYEKLCVDAAMTRKDAIHLIHAIDTKIDELEAALEKAQEARRELVNFYNLNKCEHDWHNVPHTPTLVCRTCGERK